MIYYTVMDCGDGSYSTVFCESMECVEYLCETHPNTYPENSWGVLKDPPHVTQVYTLENLKRDDQMARKLQAAREATARAWEKVYPGIERASIVAKIRAGDDPAMGDVALCVEAINLYLEDSK